MKIDDSTRGFRRLLHERYLEPHDNICLAQESSAIGNYEDSSDEPGSSFLWIGEHHHLDRKQVKTLIGALRHWLRQKRLPAEVKS